MLRRILIALLSVMLVTTVAAPANAAYEVKGKILATYVAKGGEAVYGQAQSAETKIIAYSRNTYHEHFTKGVVYWDGSQGGKAWLNGSVPSLSYVKAERDALGRYGYKAGALFRSAKLCNATTNNKRLITALVHGGAILDLRTGSVCSEPSFPSVVAKKRISIPAHADYSRYVTGKTERTQFGLALTYIANTPGPIWVHCTEGKDRTGWAIAMAMYAIGADTPTVREEFLRTDKASLADFNEGLEAIFDNYDGVEGYLTDGLGLSATTLDKLQYKLGA